MIDTIPYDVILFLIVGSIHGVLQLHMMSYNVTQIHKSQNIYDHILCNTFIHHTIQCNTI